MNWTELFARAERVRRELLTEAWRRESPLLLQATTRQGGLLMLAVGVLWPFEVILDEKNLQHDVTAFRLHEAMIPADLIPDGTRIHSDANAPRPGAWFEAWRISLCTSGSTGEPQRIQKTGAGLLAEVHDLAALYGWNETDVVLSLVSPLHIYGLLHAFLLPWFCRTAVEFVSFQEGPPDPSTLSSSHYAAVIGVPATWGFVKDLLRGGRLNTLVMSGAPFGDKRRRELQAAAHPPARAWEILGSTETGGIGTRALLTDDDFFQCLPSVRVFEMDGRQWVSSPYLSPATSCPLADRLRILEQGRFLHLGRMDRIFKYAGQRHALGEVERVLSQMLKQAETFVQFHADDGVAQGGWLEAWVEGEEPCSVAELRPRYHEATRAPFPHVLHFLPNFPRDSQGKLQVHALRQEFPAPFETRSMGARS